MEGFDRDWRQLKKGYVSYTNLDPGEYVFSVKGSNNDGIMNEQGDSIRVIITPPFWKTWWFRLSALVFVSGVLAFFIRYRINQVKAEERRKTEFNRQLSETRMQALRAQMNPHFIFNSLNSIQECVVTGKNDEAVSYLSKFSRLVRMILQNSSKEEITLSAEIDSINLYLEVESLRFSKDFSYVLEVDPVLETELIRMPPMLVQPFVENALWHGLAHKEGEKSLVVRFHEWQNQLVCEVEDNGIGRNKAQLFSHKNHQSVGMKNTSERLGLLGANASVEIIDLPGDSGTKVILRIPV
jgi:LytS/YehU family sensor histidine kinase